MMNRMTPFVALCFAGLCGALFGQTQKARITGIITDSSGAAISGASVIITQVETGIRRNAETNEVGVYDAPLLDPGKYSVAVKKQGFRSVVQSGIELHANDSVQISVPLEIGTLTETVEVTAKSVGQVETENAVIREVVDQRRVVDLPLNGRNAAQLSTLVPGVVVAPAANVDMGVTKTAPGGVVVASNGARQGQVSYRLDGGSNTDPMSDINQPFPFPDALQEFSVQTSNYSAAYGNNAGAVVNVVTRAGTNEFHGAAFGFVRNRVFNARNFFASDRSFLKRNQEGAAGGGRIIRDKMFFFVGWQGTYLRDQNSSANAFVPTVEELAGNFSACGAPCSRSIRDPLTNTPFPGNQIPVSRFDSASLKVATGYLPVSTGTGQIFYTGGKVIQNTNDGIGRFDYQIRSNDHVNLRYFISDFQYAGKFNPKNILIYGDSSAIRSHNAVLAGTHIFSPSLLSDTRFTFYRVSSARIPPPGAPSVRDFGVNIYTPNPNSIENISVSGSFGTGDDPVAVYARTGYEFTEQVFWTRGRHSVIFGGEVAAIGLNENNQARLPGSFTFTGDYSGNAMADFLLGRVRGFQQNAGAFLNNRNTFFDVFVQDDYRASQRLTLNLGVRYEPFWPWNEIAHRLMRFEPADYASGFQSRVFRNAPPGLSFPGDPGFPDRGVHGDFNNLAPRFGLAWDVRGDGKTSVRSGGGIFYNQRTAAFTNLYTGTITPFALSVVVADLQAPFSNPYQNMTNPFPAGPPSPNIAFQAPVSVETYDRQAVSVILYNWNLSIERALGGGWVAHTAYVGSHGSHGLNFSQLNPANPSLTGTTDARRLFQPYGSIKQITYDGNSSYNAVQIGLNHRFSHGLTVLANYTFSKSLDTYPPNALAIENNGTPSGIPRGTPNGRSFDSGPSDFDHAHRAVVSYVWDIPGVKGANSKVLGRLLNGWQNTAIFQYQTGGPLTIKSGVDNSRTGLNNDRAILTGQPIDRPTGIDPVVQFFNTGAFALNPPGTFGVLGKGALRGPSMSNWDIGLFKTTKVRERFSVQFRAEFFNAFNQVNFDNPGTSVNAANFGRIQSAGDPRIIQFGLKLLF